MRTTTSAFLLLALVAGCEHKNKNQQASKPTSGSAVAGSGSAGGGGGTENPLDKPEPVVKDSADLRAPTAADLAEYTKDIPGEGKLLAKIETTNGTLNCELYGDKAPMTVANFVGLATGKKAWKNPKTGEVVKGTPFFDGLVFHRVIPGFMIQGGDPMGVGRGGPGYEFEDEQTPDLKMVPGTLAMANSGPATNGSQFFVMEGAAEWLEGKHTNFGKCKEVDVVKAITNVPKICPDCAPNDPRSSQPATPVKITKVTISKGSL